MTSHDLALLNALLYNDFQSFMRRGFHTLHPGTGFMDNWHHAAITYQLERVRRGEITRLIINLPDRLRWRLARAGLGGDCRERRMHPDRRGPFSRTPEAIGSRP